jgi:hypothetical protein
LISASVSVCLSLLLTRFHHSIFLGRFPFFCLWPCFLPSCCKAINLAGPAAGSRQSLSSKSWGGGGSREMGMENLVAATREGRGAEKNRMVPLPESSHSCLYSHVWTSFLQNTDICCLCCETGTWSLSCPKPRCFTQTHWSQITRWQICLFYS